MDYFKERKNKVEAEASKLRQERLRKLYPTWDFIFDKFNEEQLRMFATTLDSKIESCQERINMLKKKRYIEEKQEQKDLEDIENSKDANESKKISQEQIKSISNAGNEIKLDIF